MARQKKRYFYIYGCVGVYTYMIFYSMLVYIVIIITNLRSQFTVCMIIQYAGSSWDELKHVRQAVGFLVCFCSSESR